jgi:glucose-6-phosphate isomerase
MTEPLRETNAWRRLEWHHGELAATTLRELFAADPSRGERLTAEAAGLYLDFSKHLVTDDTLSLLRRLAVERGLEERVRAMFRGERVNVSEGRAALHAALRMPASRSLVVDGVDVVKEVHEELSRMASFAGSLRMRAVVNIGIGGSDLGPAMAYEALRSPADPVQTVRFVSNVDPLDLDLALSGLDPVETLVVVVSKTFTTIETMENARRAQSWLGDANAGNLVGVAASPERGEALGIPPERMLRLWDWVGGRTSLWSAAGLSLCIALGEESFRELLAGAHAMDEHFRSAALGGNLPAIHGLLSVWYRDFWNAQTTAVVPYSTALRLLPAYLQQLWMESNGKRVTAAGEPVDADTGSILWGGHGTNAQHATFQLLHQGTTLVPVDLLGFATSAVSDAAQHDLLAANLLAQAEALAFGRTEDELRDAGAPEETIPHRVMPGNRPSSVLLAERLDPATLGALLALYEHSVFTQAAIWDIDPFDQWGVELGKELAAKIAPELAADWKHELLHDSSTNALVRRYRALRDGR